MFFWEKPRPVKKYEIRECGKDEWQKLRKYHYLNSEHSATAECYGVYDEEKLIGFCSVMHFPHPRNPKIKHIHRLVIHPDYQGIGLGKKTLNFVSNIYHERGFDVNIITSAKNLIAGLSKDASWGCCRFGKVGKIGNKSTIRGLKDSSSKARRTATFRYVGANNDRV